MRIALIPAVTLLITAIGILKADTVITYAGAIHNGKITRADEKMVIILVDTPDGPKRKAFLRSDIKTVRRNAETPDPKTDNRDQIPDAADLARYDKQTLVTLATNLQKRLKDTREKLDAANEKIHQLNAQAAEIEAETDNQIGALQKLVAYFQQALAVIANKHPQIKDDVLKTLENFAKFEDGHLVSGLTIDQFTHLIGVQPVEIARSGGDDLPLIRVHRWTTPKRTITANSKNGYITSFSQVSHVR